jgi:hypothetical protein
MAVGIDERRQHEADHAPCAAMRRESRRNAPALGTNAYGALSELRSIIAAQGWSRAPPRCGSQPATGCEFFSYERLELGGQR